MEEMTVSSSVCWTSSLDGQMSQRYTSFPSEVTPAPPTGLSMLVSIIKHSWQHLLSLMNTFQLIFVQEVETGSAQYIKTYKLN